MRVIDAALLESKINEFIADDVNDIKHQQHREGAKYAVKRIRKIIQDVPTLNVQPVVYAHWTLHKDGTATCSNCNRACGSWDYDSFDRFCRCCGATMSLKEK